MPTYCVHFEPLGTLGHGNERPTAWMARIYKGDDPDECYRREFKYAASFGLDRLCLDAAEAKGLDRPITPKMFRAVMLALPRIGIEVLQYRRSGDPELHKYFVEDFL